MARTGKIFAGLALVVLVSACAQQRAPEPTYVAPEPVTAPQTYSKY